MTRFTREEKRAEALREAAYRERVYARLVKEGRMKPYTADRALNLMREIADDYAPTDLFGEKP